MQHAAKAVIAYVPFWPFGTERQLQQHRLEAIRDCIKKLRNDAGEDCKYSNGGSVNAAMRQLQRPISTEDL